MWGDYYRLLDPSEIEARPILSERLEGQDELARQSKPIDLKKEEVAKISVRDVAHIGPTTEVSLSQRCASDEIHPKKCVRRCIDGATYIPERSTSRAARPPWCRSTALSSCP
jgi:hypothetical protein